VAPPALLLFDGECGLCDRAVRFLARRDRRRLLRFAPLQGETAAPWRELARSTAGGPFEWLALVEDPDGGAGARVHLRSAAVARALQIVGGRWAVAGALLARAPRRVSDAAYLAVARRRHWLPASCALPAAGDARFLR
jgi:predicted DCC family thiol-disulfide oxidoreductase YuxK